MFLCNLAQVDCSDFCLKKDVPDAAAQFLKTKALLSCEEISQKVVHFRLMFVIPVV